MTYTLYSMQNSGNCYKPRLLMHQLGIPFRLVDTDSFDGSTRTPEYLALNPNGKVPLLVLPDGRRLAESNAMLLHLAEGTPCLPADRYAARPLLPVAVLRAVQPRALYRGRPLLAQPDAWRDGRR